MLDESTAAAEAMTLARRCAKSKSNVYVVDADVLPQTLTVIATRAEPLGIEVQIVDLDAVATGEAALPDEFSAYTCSTPAPPVALRDHAALVGAAHAARPWLPSRRPAGLTLLRAPVRSARHRLRHRPAFGVPMGFGGPHAGYLASGPDSSARCPVAWSESPRTSTATALSLHCRLVSSTSVARRDQ